MTPHRTEDGSIVLVEELEPGVTMTVGRVEAPWAVDSAGNAVPTEYSIQGDELVQVLHTGPDTAYPVVADPTFGHTYGIPTMYLNWSETVTAQDANNLAPICALAPTPLNFFCAANVVLLSNGAEEAVDQGKCVKYLLSPVAVSGLPYSC